MSLSIALPPEIQNVVDDFDIDTDDYGPSQLTAQQSDDLEADSKDKKKKKSKIPLFNPLIRSFALFLFLLISSLHFDCRCDGIQ